MTCGKYPGYLGVVSPVLPADATNNISLLRYKSSNTSRKDSLYSSVLNDKLIILAPFSTHQLIPANMVDSLVVTPPSPPWKTFAINN